MTVTNRQLENRLITKINFICAFFALASPSLPRRWLIHILCVGDEGGGATPENR